MIIRKWLGRFGAVIGASVAMLAIAAAPHRAVAVEPQPAMWVVRDADSTIYLFGTFHAIKPDMNWRTAKIDAAFQASDELWTEVSGMTDPATKKQIEALVLQHGFDFKHPLSSKLDSNDAAQLQKLVEDLGYNAAAADRMRPWLAAITLSMAPALRGGYDLEHGVDYVLEMDAKAAHKKQNGFETPEQQIMIFAELSPEDELNFLRQSLRAADETKKKIFDQLAEAWLTGDIDTMGSLLLQAMETEAPGLQDAIFTRRNQAWSRQLATVMEGAGTSFVAVGAGHMIGDGSLPALLTDLGFKVERY
jgi:uncharacterized protein YbaP (TraB family)